MQVFEIWVFVSGGGGVVFLGGIVWVGVDLFCVCFVITYYNQIAR